MWRTHVILVPYLIWFILSSPPLNLISTVATIIIRYSDIEQATIALGFTTLKYLCQGCLYSYGPGVEVGNSVRILSEITAEQILSHGHVSYTRTAQVCHWIVVSPTRLEPTHEDTLRSYFYLFGAIPQNLKKITKRKEHLYTNITTDTKWSIIIV